MSRSTGLQSLRSWLEVNLFIRRVLRPFRPLAWCLTVLLLCVAAWLATVDYTAGAWLSFVAGVVGLARELFPVAADFFRSPRSQLRDDTATLERLPGLRPSARATRRGFRIVSPPGTGQLALQSDAMDRWLRCGGDIPVRVEHGLRDDLERFLRRNGGALEDVLRCRYRRSRQSDPPRTFVDESKFCLGDDPVPGMAELEVFRSGYFHSVLTNEMAARILESRGSNPAPLFAGAQMYPFTDERIPDIKGSNMANHVGISTLAVTRDGQLLVWNQDGRAQHSRNQLAPTGSGSCDWKDFEATRGAGEGNTLMQVVLRAMERELREESSLHGVADARITSRVLGYFRWMNRGGKPEFVGISRVDAPARTLQPNAAEVNAPSGRGYDLAYPAGDAGELARSLRRILESPQVSLPLAMNAAAACAALRENEAALSALLWP